jgi:hypothetical protein
MISYTTLFLIIYIVFNIYLSKVIYKHTRRYYRPITVEEENEDGVKSISLHDKYSEFSRKDNFSYFRILFGLIFLFWIRLIGMLLTSMSFFIILKIVFRNNNNHNADYRRKLAIFSKIHARLTFFIFGIRRTILTPQVNDVYCKYLGPNYDFEESNYSCIITNHTSWYEIVYLIYEESAGFIAKQSVRNIPFIGYIAYKLDSLFLDRTNEKNRNDIVIL